MIRGDYGRVYDKFKHIFPLLWPEGRPMAGRTTMDGGAMEGLRAKSRSITAVNRWFPEDAGARPAPPAGLTASFDLPLRHPARIVVFSFQGSPGKQCPEPYQKPEFSPFGWEILGPRRGDLFSVWPQLFRQEINPGRIENPARRQPDLSMGQRSGTRSPSPAAPTWAPTRSPGILAPAFLWSMWQGRRVWCWCLVKRWGRWWGWWVGCKTGMRSTRLAV